MEPEEAISESVLCTTFTVRNKRCRVYFRRGTLLWRLEKNQNETKLVSLKDILSVDVLHDSSCSCKTIGFTGAENEAFQGTIIVPAPKHDKLVVNYAALKKNNIYRTHSVVFKHEDTKQVAEWVSAIQHSLDELNRPRRFLAFVNPNSGKRSGQRIYRKFVEPILQLGNVRAHLIVTEHANHSRDYIMSEDLSQFDAILTVGGDGTVSEVINALVRRKIKDSGGNCEDENVQIPRLDIPLAVIPGGSTDCIAYTFNGTLDKRTAAIYAVLGEVSGLDLCTVTSDRGLLKCFVSLLGYGFLGDVLKTSEKYRWMGPKRYDFAGTMTFISNKRYDCEVTMRLHDQMPGVGPLCYRNCETCSASNQALRRRSRYQESALTRIRDSLNTSSGEELTPRTVTVNGQFLWLTCANISCACERSPLGVSPRTHLADGSMDVILIRPRNVLDLFRMLARSTSKSPSITFAELPFVESYKVTELTFKALNRDLTPMAVNPTTAQGVHSSVWNCDGEIVLDSNVNVRNHRAFVSLLSRRCAPPTKTENLSSFHCLNCSKRSEDFVS